VGIAALFERLIVERILNFNLVVPFPKSMTSRARKYLLKKLVLEVLSVYTMASICSLKRINVISRMRRLICAFASFLLMVA